MAKSGSNKSFIILLCLVVIWRILQIFTLDEIRPNAKDVRERGWFWLTWIQHSSREKNGLPMCRFQKILKNCVFFCLSGKKSEIFGEWRNLKKFLKSFDIYCRLGSSSFQFMSIKFYNFIVLIRIAFHFNRLAHFPSVTTNIVKKNSEDFMFSCMLRGLLCDLWGMTVKHL